MTTNSFDNEKVAKLILQEKYLQEGETPREGCIRVAHALKDSEEHYDAFKEILIDQRFLPGGRIQAAVGATRLVTPYNCFVSRTIDDSMKGIVDAFAEAVETMRFGGGIGYDFSTLRPSGSRITTLDSTSTGPVGDANTKCGFMDIFDAGCSVIRSAGHRRGAQMGVLRVDHPDIVNFIRAKQTKGRLTNFNISVGVTDEFMEAVKKGTSFSLTFNNEIYEKVNARNLWDELMRSTWNHAEPGVLFIDRINKKNNLWYCETIAATNPCGEQPLPPYGACLLGSLNLVKYIAFDSEGFVYFDFDKLGKDIPHIVRAMDNVIDRAIYPLEEQRIEAQTKRRMGIGVTGLANTLEMLGVSYGSNGSLIYTDSIMMAIRDYCYMASIDLAKEKGSFELLDKEKFLQSGFAKTLPDYIRNEISEFGIRNSHLLSVAPTGTISLTANNVSSGIEPPFLLEYERGVYRANGAVERFKIADYAYLYNGIKGKTADEISAADHVRMLCTASKYVDSSVSKTCNVGPEVTFEEFKDIYMMAYDGGASGCTTYRAGNIDDAPLQALGSSEGAACFIDPETGQKTCE